MIRRATDFYLRAVKCGAEQTAKLDCGHTLAVPGATTEAEATLRWRVSQGDLAAVWELDCPECATQPQLNPK